MKPLIYILLVTSLTFGGRLGIGFSAGGEYDKNYQTIDIYQLPDLYFGGEFHLQAEALPNLYLEPLVTFLNNPDMSTAALGFGLRVNIEPRLGRFFIAPFFGAEGTVLLYNDNVDLLVAAQTNRFDEYIETSHPKPVGQAFVGLKIYLGKSISLDGQYRYLSLTENYGVQMAWAGLTFYINW